MANNQVTGPSVFDDDARRGIDFPVHHATAETTGEGGEMNAVLRPLTSTYQRVAGFLRIKSKASGRALAAPDYDVQLSAHLHLREHGKPKTESTGSPDEQLYVLTVLWLNWRVVLELRRRDGDRARVAEAVGETEAEAWQEIERQLELLGL